MGNEEWVIATYTLPPSPFPLHPSPFTLHPSPFTLHPSPITFPAMRSLLSGLTLIAISLLVPAHVLAQAFPGKVVRLIIPFPTGSSTDAQARIFGPLLSERWKQQVIVDSRPGATTIIGTDLVAKSPPDGHTLLFTSIQ